MKIWDRKYNSWMFVPFSDDGVTSNDGKDRFIAKGGRGYKLTDIQANELLEEDDWLPPESEKSGKRFVIHE